MDIFKSLLNLLTLYIFTFASTVAFHDYTSRHYTAADIGSLYSLANFRTLNLVMDRLRSLFFVMKVLIYVLFY